MRDLDAFNLPYSRFIEGAQLKAFSSPLERLVAGLLPVASQWRCTWGSHGFLKCLELPVHHMNKKRGEKGHEDHRWVALGELRAAVEMSEAGVVSPVVNMMIGVSGKVEEQGTRERMIARPRVSGTHLLVVSFFRGFALERVVLEIVHGLKEQDPEDRHRKESECRGSSEHQEDDANQRCLRHLKAEHLILVAEHRLASPGQSISLHFPGTLPAADHRTKPEGVQDLAPS